MRLIGAGISKKGFDERLGFGVRGTVIAFTWSSVMAVIASPGFAVESVGKHSEQTFRDSSLCKQAYDLPVLSPRRRS
jgi:hypothetical protein